MREAIGGHQWHSEASSSLSASARTPRIVEDTIVARGGPHAARHPINCRVEREARANLCRPDAIAAALVPCTGHISAVLGSDRASAVLGSDAVGADRQSGRATK
jgi:hypothetical protein